MRPERWRQIDRLYQSALERDATERGAFLDGVCGGDEELRREVESLLAAHEKAKEAEDFLNQPAMQVAAQVIADDQAQSPTPRKLGRYQILSLLGRGGMGEVYLAEDPRLGRKLALKLLPQEFTLDRERVRRFKQEARAASGLNHPNIITIFEIDQIQTEAGGVHFIAAEFIDGQTLRQCLAGGAMKLSEALDVAVQVASALAEAHAAGIVHRDIKPENIMLRRDGYVKVLDFGLAKLIEPLSTGDTSFKCQDSSLREFHSDPGIMMGTPRYMSPEQIRGRQVDARADIFSLGVVLYEMVAGRVPFDGGAAGEVIAAVLNHEPSPLSRCAPDAPAELGRIVDKSLAKDREQRYQSAKNLLAELKGLKLELELADKLKQTGQAATPIEAGERQPMVADAISTLLLSHPPPAGDAHTNLEPVGGAMPLNSKFYIVRGTDEEFRVAIARQDSIVLIKGARQVGKTSLLARGLQQARAAGAKVVLTDLQKLNASDLASAEAFYLALADLIADQLGLDVAPDAVWNARRGPSINFERYIRREALGKIATPLVWGLDEVDRLFTCSFGSEVFGLFRSWHNERSLDPAGPWQRLTMAIAYATEAHLFITDMNQSPFNVGTRLTLEDFTCPQLADLNERYGSPLKDEAEVARYYSLVSGHPYLARCGLQEMVVRRRDLAELEAIADREDGPFGDHLRRVIASLEQDPALREVARGILQGQPCPTQESFYRLRSAGLFAGDSARYVRPRCQLYATYLEKRLL
ncbi:MAG TPA: serine/threonine-protein kinase [Blastocatellia bacterium]|jgi:serine/threonine protein kinase|nr:serine/threonine-protein kinase [Blastocatellia bacterium]